MVRARTLAASIAAHAVLAGVLVYLGPSHVAHPTQTTTAIELVDATVVEKPSPVSALAAAGGGGGASAPAPRARAKAPRMRSAVLEDPRGELRIEATNGTGDGGTGGEGTGTGGSGRGLGLGEGARVEPSTELALAPPPAPAASKARPARLVYPSRQRDDDGELFVARVTIDADGYVVGARLVRGFGGPRDTTAADLIWKFRYAPALNDDGRPIVSTLDQRFLVGR